MVINQLEECQLRANTAKKKVQDRWTLDKWLVMMEREVIGHMLVPEIQIQSKMSVCMKLKHQDQNRTWHLLDSSYFFI